MRSGEQGFCEYLPSLKNNLFIRKLAGAFLSVNLSMTGEIQLNTFTDKDSPASILIHELFLREGRILIGRFTDKDSPSHILIERFTERAKYGSKELLTRIVPTTIVIGDLFFREGRYSP